MSFMQALLGKGASRAARFSKSAYNRMGKAESMGGNIFENVLGAGGQSANKALRWGSRSSSRAYGMVGAIGGGAYGAVSDDTSILGGAMMGAGLGAGGVQAVRGARGFANRYAASAALTKGRGEAFRLAGMASGRHIGRSLSKSATSVGSTLKQTGRNLSDWWTAPLGA
tara:strand:- start:3184 stop:3690 length:507 start_codon:yes stop_codon:yes gene_type:complete